MKAAFLGLLAAAGLSVPTLSVALGADDDVPKSEPAAAPVAKSVRLTVVTAEGGG